MLSGSARLWHSACSLALRRSQSRKRSQLHRARRSRKTIHEAQADVTGLTKRPETNITTTKKLRSHENINESLASVRVGNSSTSTWIELAEQRRTQRARARYHPCQELTRARKDGEMTTSDGKPRAQAIPRRCFSRARPASMHAACAVQRPGPGRDEIGWQQRARRSIYKYIVSTARVAVPCEQALQSSCSVTELLKTVENSRRREIRSVEGEIAQV